MSVGDGPVVLVSDGENRLALSSAVMIFMGQITHLKAVLLLINWIKSSKTMPFNDKYSLLTGHWQCYPSLGCMTLKPSATRDRQGGGRNLYSL